MSLVADIQSKPLTTTLHYLKRGTEKPTRYVEDPPPGVPQWNGIDDPHQVATRDAETSSERWGPCATWVASAPARR